jgi:hypothetical protein
MNELEQPSNNKMAKQLIEIMRKIIRKQKIKNIFNDRRFQKLVVALCRKSNT